MKLTKTTIAAIILSGLSLALGACGPADQQAQEGPGDTQALPSFSPQAMKAHVNFLADDLLKGRETGTPEYDIAANYVATNFAALGLVPAGDDGSYLQPVTFATVAPVGDAALMNVRTAGGSQTLTYLDDFIMGGRAAYAQAAINAPVVFVGFGISAPDFDHDDYAGLDVTDKVVAVLSGGPKDWPSSERAHYASGRTKAKEASDRGAIGMINLRDLTLESRWPYASSVLYAEEPGFTWMHPDGTGYTSSPNLQVVATLNPASSDILFAGTGKSFAEIQAEAEAGTVTPLALNVEVTMAQKSRYETVTSPNVAALLNGSDPDLSQEVIVISAHLDHIGEGPEDQEDNINNGAMDNAVGIATMLDVARVMATAEEKPRRSVLFLALTAEEKGLLGSEYFANYPTVAEDKIIANVNLDMPVLLYDFSDVIAFGAEHSTLGAIVADAVARADVGLSPDPIPEQGIFTRSDHYRFVQKGIPSVFLFTGWGETADGLNGGEIWSDFFATHYHKPSDQPDLPIDYDAGAKFALINWLIINEIANSDAKPSWNADSFFGNLYAPSSALAPSEGGSTNDGVDDQTDPAPQSTIIDGDGAHTGPATDQTINPTEATAEEVENAAKEAAADPSGS